MFWAKGIISLENDQATDDKVKAFSGARWSKATGGFLGKIEAITPNSMEEIMHLAKASCTPKCRQGLSTKQVHVTFDEDDLVEGSRSFSGADRDPLFGWLPGCTKNGGSRFTVGSRAVTHAQQLTSCSGDARRAA